MPLTFALKNPRDLLAKLHHEHERLKHEVTSYDFFNFVVTGWHIQDWVSNSSAVAAAVKADLATMRSDAYVAVCRDLANASKHFELNYRPTTADATSQQGFGVGRFGAGAFGVGEESITIRLTNGVEYDALSFAQAVVDAWETFFSRHQL